MGKVQIQTGGLPGVPLDTHRTGSPYVHSNRSGRYTAPGVGGGPGAELHAPLAWAGTPAHRGPEPRSAPGPETLKMPKMEL